MTMDPKKLLHYEIGGYRRRGGEVSVCLVYPNTYEVGMANLGFQLVYKLLNQQEGVVCERAFMDTGLTRSLETGRKLHQFHIVAFSLSYEVDFLNILRTLRAANILPHTTERTGLPLLVLGGIAAFANPLPYSSFFDLICIGEAEEVLSHFINTFKNTRERQACLEDASELEGVWVPLLGKKRVRRVFVQNLNDIETCAASISPFSHFKNMLLVEVERGCPFDCRFCLAKQAYSPYRTKNANLIVKEIDRARMKTESIGLVGAAISEVPGLTQLVRDLSELAENIGISSLRLDRVNIGLLRALVQAGLKTMTIAPEAGTEKLRYITNKRIKDDKILELAQTAQSLKVKRIKLYFMIGLPFEKEEDLIGMVDLVRRFRQSYRGELVISVNPFVPKAHTPFQYHRMETRKVLSHKISFVRKELRKIERVKLITKSPREALLQALLSLGNTSIGEVILNVVDEGVRWEDALKETRIDIEKYLGGKPADSVLPWDFIDFRVDPESLVQSYNEARKLSQDT